MEQLYEAFDLRLRSVPLKYSRFLMPKINWQHRLISIFGARGAGKTTLILQHIAKQFGTPSREVLYADVSHFYFSSNSIFELADKFYKRGGRFLFLDEIHKYAHWSAEIKQIYDTYSGLNIVFTGSSILEIEKGEADLSRRVVKYNLPGMSFREFIGIETGVIFDEINIQDILNNHMALAHKVVEKIKPLAYFEDYLRFGYYPFYSEGRDVYAEKLSAVVNLVLETDVPAVENIDYQTIVKLKKLLAIISASVPFKPNVMKIAALSEVSRPTLMRLMALLERAQLINTLQSASRGIQQLGKPDKVYLQNTNLMFMLAPGNSNTGNLRETFFLNQLLVASKIELPGTGDFLVNGRWIFEVGGKNKTLRQIAGLENAYIAADDIETGYDRKIPLWLFGFLY